MMHWATQYIGLPYKAGGRERDGIDCWGLLRLVYREQLGIALPELPGLVADCNSMISRENFALCAENWAVLPQPQEWAAVGMSRKEHIHHVGVWTGSDGGRVIHCWENKPIVADTPRTLLLKGMRIKDFFVWQPT